MKRTNVAEEVAMPKLTKRYVETIIPDSEKSLIFWDTELKGFGVVITQY